MAGPDESQFSLMSLEEELTCSICLSTFDCPVTIPCGHNFCQDCLLATWKDSYSCPECRTHFATRPELRKNTVLSTVVNTFNMRSSGRTEAVPEPQGGAGAPGGLRCDTCMEAEASRTCLTCMASFCEEHLRPHRENPTFRLHQLSEPVGDLLERICPDHHKLMELFCTQHGRPICSHCLQQVHKGCPFVSPEEQRNLKESDLRSKLGLLDGKITKNENVVAQMKVMQGQLKDSAANRKRALAAEFQQMRDMLTRDEQDALAAVDRELETGQTKLNVLTKKFIDNIDHMNKAKDGINELLSRSQSLAFLQASFDLPQAAAFDPYTPRLSLDSKKVTAAQGFTAALKELLTEVLKQPVEARLPLLRPGPNSGAAASDETAAPSGPTSSGNPGSQSKPEQAEAQKQKRKPRSHSPGHPPLRPGFQPLPVPGCSFGAPHGGWTALQFPQEPNWHQGFPVFPVSGPGFHPKPAPKKKAQKQTKKGPQSKDDSVGSQNRAASVENLLDAGGKDKPRGRPAAAAESPNVPLNITSAEKRHELLKHGSVLVFNPKTAHKRIALTEGSTKASVSDEPKNYPDCPERFAVCSQVLAAKGFSTGRHYWEVKLSSSNFVGVGLAYGSIDRKGPASRLGRNAQSWCVEWFNVKLSAWHDNRETVLANPSPKRVGVLLDCEAGVATFYNVMDRAYPFHSFVFSFAEAVYPAFWIFSSSSSITLCKLQD